MRRLRVHRSCGSLKHWSRRVEAVDDSHDDFTQMKWRARARQADEQQRSLVQLTARLQPGRSGLHHSKFISGNSRGNRDTDSWLDSVKPTLLRRISWVHSLTRAMRPGRALRYSSSVPVTMVCGRLPVAYHKAPQERSTQNGEKVSDIHCHDGQHAAKRQIRHDPGLTGSRILTANSSRRPAPYPVTPAPAPR